MMLSRERTITILGRRIKSNERLIESTKRKRSLRASEKAMTVAYYMEENEAIRSAVMYIKDNANGDD